MPAGAEVEKKALEAALLKKAYTGPEKGWLALCEEEPKRTWTGKEIEEHAKELSYTSYARKELKLEAATWKVKAGTEAEVTKVTNEAAVEMTPSTGNVGNRKAKWFMICENKAASEGAAVKEIMFYGKLTAELEITTSITKVEFKAGELEVSAE